MSESGELDSNNQPEQMTEPLPRYISAREGFESMKVISIYIMDSVHKNAQEIKNDDGTIQFMKGDYLCAWIGNPPSEQSIFIQSHMEYEKRDGNIVVKSRFLN